MQIHHSTIHRFFLPLFLAVACSFISAPTASAQAGMTYKGYLKQLNSLGLSDDLGKRTYDNIVHFRMETVWRYGASWKLQADARSRLFTGYNVRNVPGYGAYLEADPGYVDLSRNLIDNPNMILNTSIDRLHLSWINGPWEAHLGRQRMNWGKTMVWNPNDLFNAYAYLDFDYEERPGTDALNVQYSWSFASSIEFGVKFADNPDESVYAAMYRGNLGTYDVQLIAGKYLEQFVAGAGWSGYLKDAGFKGEISWFAPTDSIDASFTGSIGADYMFSGGYFGTVELLYNGGWQRSNDAFASLSQPPSASNLFIADTGYFLNLSASPHPLVNFSAGIMGSFTRSVFILIPQVALSVTEELDMLILAQSLRGSTLKPHLETPNYLFVRFKWSF